jgi:4-aminobutyrate aminotransferase
MTEATATSLIARDAAVFFHQSGSSPVARAARTVSGLWIEDETGRRYMDLHGNTVHHLGHAHPRLVAALKAQLDELPFCPRRFTNAPAVALAEKLGELWRGRGTAKCLFATGGSDAIEIALRLARVATGRSETISLEGSYHGHGFGALGLSHAALDPRLGPHLPGRWHVTPYWDASKGGANRMLDDMRRAFAASRGGIAAVVAEPIRSNCHVPHPALWPEVRALCDAHGAILIFDEIPTGLGKTGRFFAHEHFDVAPDIVVLGKALGGGIVPIAAVIADARLDVAPDLDLGHYTHEKNPLTTRAALTTIEIIEDDGLVERAAIRGRYVLQKMAELDAPGLARGRGLGLLLAWRVAPGADSHAQAERLAARSLDYGVSTTTKGGDAVGVSLPLVVEEAEIDDALSRLAAAARSL